MRPTLAPPGGSFGMFSRTDWRLTGRSDSALDRAVRRGDVIRVATNCFVDAAAWNGDSPFDEHRRLAICTVAAQRRVQNCAASHASAAVLDGLPIWRVPQRACVTVRPRYTGDARAAHLHRAQLPDEHLMLSDHGSRTRVERTVSDIAREHGVEDALVAGDGALARGMTDESRLLACAQRCAGWPGSRRAERVLELLDPRSESPLESVSRLRLLEAGIPPAELQIDILTLDGWFLGRLDFYWDEFGVAGEVDGLVKYGEDPLAALLKEKRRQQPMDERGVIFVRWGLADLGRPRQLAERLEAAFGRGARRPRSDRGWIARPAARFAPGIVA